MADLLGIPALAGIDFSDIVAGVSVLTLYIIGLAMTWRDQGRAPRQFWERGKYWRTK